MSSPFHRGDEIREISEVNVVPLADVSLVLLILLLVLSPMMTQSMLKVQAAGESKAPPLPDRDPTPPPPELVLSVGLRPGAITVGDRVFQEPGSFMQYMQAILVSRADKKVFLTPVPEVPNGQVVNMLETLKLCGASSVALVQVQEEPDAAGGAAQPGAAPGEAAPPPQNAAPALKSRAVPGWGGPARGDSRGR